MRRLLFSTACLLLLPLAGCEIVADLIDDQLYDRTPKEQLEHDLNKSMWKASKEHNKWLGQKAQEKALRESMQSF